MFSDFIKMLHDGTLASSLKSLSGLVSVFNPTLGGGLMMASQITDNFKEVDDSFLENEVVGLTGCATRLQKMVDSKQVDYDQLELIVNNLNSIATYTQKSAKLIS